MGKTENELRAKVQDVTLKLGEHFKNSAYCGRPSVEVAIIVAKLYEGKSILEDVYCSRGVELLWLWLQVMGDFEQFKEKLPID